MVHESVALFLPDRAQITAMSAEWRIRFSICAAEASIEDGTVVLWELSLDVLFWHSWTSSKTAKKYLRPLSFCCQNA